MEDGVVAHTNRRGLTEQSEPALAGSGLHVREDGLPQFLHLILLTKIISRLPARAHQFRHVLQQVLIRAQLENLSFGLVGPLLGLGHEGEALLELMALLAGPGEVVTLEGELLFKVRDVRLECRQLFLVVLFKTLLCVSYHSLQPFLLSLHFLSHIPVILTLLPLHPFHFFLQLLDGRVGPIEFLPQLPLLPLHGLDCLFVLLPVSLLQLLHLLVVDGLHGLDSGVPFLVLALVEDLLFL